MLRSYFERTSVSSSGCRFFSFPMFGLIIETRCGFDQVDFRDYLVSDDLLESFMTLLLPWNSVFGRVPFSTSAVVLDIVLRRWFMPPALFLTLLRGRIFITVIS